MVAQAPAIAPPPSNWAERHGGWIVSLCLHLVALSFLVSSQAPPPPAPPPRPVRLVLSPERPEPPPPEPARALPQAEPAPQPLPPEPEPPVLRVEEARSTRAADAQPEPAAAEPETAEPVAEESEPPPPPEESVMTEAQRRKVEALLERYAQGETPPERSLAEARRLIDRRLEAAETRDLAARHFTDYEGARVGAVRSLQLDHPDADAVDQVMARYRIRFTTKYVDATGPSYLNSAATGGEVYTPADRAGYAEVFEISPQAHLKMVTLEREYLLSHGHDPRRVGVDEVVFGVVPDGRGGWDLGILDIKLRQVDRPGAANPLPESR